MQVGCITPENQKEDLIAECLGPYSRECGGCLVTWEGGSNPSTWPMECTDEYAFRHPLESRPLWCNDVEQTEWVDVVAVTHGCAPAVATGS